MALPWLSDHIGRRPVIILSALLCAASLAVYVGGGFDLDTMRLLAAASGVFGFGLGPIVLATCVSELVPTQLRGSALGMTNFFAVIVGTAVMPVVGGIVADQFGAGGNGTGTGGRRTFLLAALVLGIGGNRARGLNRAAATSRGSAMKSGRHDIGHDMVAIPLAAAHLTHL